MTSDFPKVSRSEKLTLEQTLFGKYVNEEIRLCNNERKEYAKTHLYAQLETIRLKTITDYLNVVPPWIYPYIHGKNGVPKKKIELNQTLRIIGVLSMPSERGYNLIDVAGYSIAQDNYPYFCEFRRYVEIASTATVEELNEILENNNINPIFQKVKRYKEVNL